MVSKDAQMDLVQSARASKKEKAEPKSKAKAKATSKAKAKGKMALKRPAAAVRLPSPEDAKYDQQVEEEEAKEPMEGTVADNGQQPLEADKGKQQQGSADEGKQQQGSADKGKQPKEGSADKGKEPKEGSTDKGKEPKEGSAGKGKGKGKKAKHSKSADDGKEPKEGKPGAKNNKKSTGKSAGKGKKTKPGSTDDGKEPKEGAGQAEVAQQAQSARKRKEPAPSVKDDLPVDPSTLPKSFARRGLPTTQKGLQKYSRCVDAFTQIQPKLSGRDKGAAEDSSCAKFLYNIYIYITLINCPALKPPSCPTQEASQT